MDHVTTREALSSTDPINTVDANLEGFAAALRVAVAAAGDGLGVSLAKVVAQQADVAATAIAALTKNRETAAPGAQRRAVLQREAAMLDKASHALWHAANEVDDLWRTDAGRTIDWLGDRAKDLAQQLQAAATWKRPNAGSRRTHRRATRAKAVLREMKARGLDVGNLEAMLAAAAK